MLSRLLFLWISIAAIGAEPETGAVPGSKLTRFFEERVQRDPEDFIAWNKLADGYLQLLRETGDDAYLALAARAAEQSLKAVPAELNPAGLALKARAEFAAHRFAAARKSATELRALLPGQSLPLQILGDALLDLGKYRAAGQVYDEMLRDEGSTLNTEARLARLDVIHGRTESAHERLAAALAHARALTPPSPENVAWCHVQLGELAFKNGDWARADAAYRSALEAQPENRSALEHLAELLGAQGRTEEAVALYHKLIDRVPRPDLLQALGDLLAFAGKHEDAKTWHERARIAYLASVERGEVHYFHHLAGFFSDSQPDPVKALEWARKDLELRQSIQAYDALAWAFHKNGEPAEAVKASAKALATAARDAHLLYHAGMIRMSAGDISGGKAALQEAITINPRYNTFHVHR